ncbi:MULTISPECIES: ribosome-associated heat shock protein Hsp15 [unclassified Arsukibacterium]|uniref:ribosome-associated heat shock protein Hsp15 n=1 Tax=unclassified Arsukibacterium TaxID=2635278 RepID=UPI000C4067F7|nr:MULTISPECIES: ribosome-associated heat shock protein Hsp15 [unclassified Arsukibacterium]MAA95084.1 heat-shock protein [Rheinheimera sp.]MBM34687.1 heat-shock protein [Rheinheimera sp.]HAW92998.1 ribosome-associated heat shock protein Hsp15 [Candidatus Azambacteria bacterium]|tara:strand:+ start:762 stop:1172 length:411 start_codon:yes stop_codon:yes gene_type:complete
MTTPQAKTQQNDSIRLDKWLWACRFYKTRALAKSMIEGGKVHYNDQRCKASRQVEIGATIKLAQGTDEKTVTVVGLSERRLAAPLAQALYQETEASTEQRLARAELRKTNSLFAPHPDTKPDKKMRRQLLLLKSKQ